MLDEANDVEDEEVVVIKTDIVEWKQNKWSGWQNHLCCVNCEIQLQTIRNRKSSSCCGGNSTPHFYTISTRQWQDHLRMHYARGHAVADEDWNLTL
jgi:hypothetical protein